MLNTGKGSIVLPVSKVEGNIPNIPQDYDTDDEIELNIFKGDNKPNVKTVARPNRYVSTGNRSLDHIEIFKECHLSTVEDKDNSLDKEQKDDSIEKKYSNNQMGIKPPSTDETPVMLTVSCETEHSKVDMTPGEEEEIPKISKTDAKIEQIEKIYVNLLEEIHSTINEKLSLINDTHDLVIDKMSKFQKTMETQKQVQFDAFQKLMQKQTKKQYNVLQQLMEKQLAEQSRVYEHLLSEKDKIISELKEEIESHKKINYNEPLFIPKEQPQTEINWTGQRETFRKKTTDQKTMNTVDEILEMHEPHSERNKENDYNTCKAEIIYLSDSTGKHINPKLLFGKKEVYHKRVSTAKQAKEIINNATWKFDKEESSMMIIQLGINDIRNGDDAVAEVTQLLSSIRNKYPVTKIGYSSPVIIRNKDNPALSN